MGRSWQRFRCHALDLAVPTWMHNHALEGHFDADTAVRFSVDTVLERMRGVAPTLGQT
jgi:hypothetical protein